MYKIIMKYIKRSKTKTNSLIEPIKCFETKLKPIKLTQIIPITKYINQDNSQNCLVLLTKGKQL